MTLSLVMGCGNDTLAVGFEVLSGSILISLLWRSIMTYIMQSIMHCWFNLQSMWHFMRSFSPFEWRRITSKNDTNLLITRKLRSKPVSHYGKYCGYVMPNVGILKKSRHREIHRSSDIYRWKDTRTGKTSLFYGPIVRRKFQHPAAI